MIAAIICTAAALTTGLAILFWATLVMASRADAEIDRFYQQWLEKSE